MNDFPAPRFVDAGGVRLAVYEAGSPSVRPPIILVHGWPEIAHAWKNQMPALVAAGFQVFAIDLKGFGLSDAPADPTLYDSRHLTNDLAGLLDGLGFERAIFCGHDWGGALVWPMAQMHPARVAGVIGVCTPHRAPPPVRPLAIIEKRFTADHYFLRFQPPGDAEALFTGREERFFRLMFRAPAPRADWPRLVPRIFDLMGRFAHGPESDPQGVILGADDLAVYIDAYRRSGFTGGINLYRNIDRNYEIAQSLDPVIRAPALFLGADLDLFLPPEGADGMETLVPDLEKRVLKDCGHWAMWEQPAALNALLVDWLTRRF